MDEPVFGGSAREWGGVRAPSIEVFEALAAEAYAALPEAFRALCGDILIRVEDFPTEAVMDEMELESPYDILGLYHGIALRARFDPPVGAMPDLIYLYRQPMLCLWAEGEETLRGLVTHVLVHEIGHHFGLSDEDMHRIEDEAD